jgi:hypothetical protein
MRDSTYASTGVHKRSPCVGIARRSLQTQPHDGEVESNLYLVVLRVLWSSRRTETRVVRGSGPRSDGQSSVLAILPTGAPESLPRGRSGPASRASVGRDPSGYNIGMRQYAQLAVTYDSRLATGGGEWTIAWYGPE